MKKDITQIDILKNIIKTKRDLEISDKNFKEAEGELIDYYAYQIKANKAKLDYLIKIVKKQNITLEVVNQLEIEKNEVI